MIRQRPSGLVVWRVGPGARHARFKPHFRCFLAAPRGTFLTSFVPRFPHLSPGCHPSADAGGVCGDPVIYTRKGAEWQAWNRAGASPSPHRWPRLAWAVGSREVSLRPEPRRRGKGSPVEKRAFQHVSASARLLEKSRRGSQMLAPTSTERVWV